MLRLKDDLANVLNTNLEESYYELEEEEEQEKKNRDKEEIQELDKDETFQFTMKDGQKKEPENRYDDRTFF
jgi:hypothetical protein